MHVDKPSLPVSWNNASSMPWMPLLLRNYSAHSNQAKSSIPSVRHHTNGHPYDLVDCGPDSIASGQTLFNSSRNAKSLFY